MTTSQPNPSSTFFVVSQVYWIPNSPFETGKMQKGNPLPEGAVIDSWDKRTYHIMIHVRAKDREPKSIKGFLDPTKAAIDCQEREINHRKGLNPFLYGIQFKDWTHFDAGRLCDWLLDAGLNPPEKAKITPNDWRRWWRENVHQMKEIQIAKVWEALDKIRFYEIEELQP